MMFLFSKQTVCYLHGRPCAPSKGFHGLIKLWQVQGKRYAKSETLGMPSHTKHLDWHGPRMYRSSSVASMYIRDRVYSFLANNPQGIIVLIIFSDLCFHHRRTQITHRRKCLASPIALTDRTFCCHLTPLASFDGFLSSQRQFSKTHPCLFNRWWMVMGVVYIVCLWTGVKKEHFVRMSSLRHFTGNTRDKIYRTSACWAKAIWSVLLWNHRWFFNMSFSIIVNV